MKEIDFLGDSLTCLRAFPDDAKQQAGYQLHRVQLGEMPNNYKFIPAIGTGVIEIRIKDANGIYRIIYTTRINDTVYVLHAFQKKTQKIAKHDIDLAKQRLKQLIEETG